jgi:hypothetical protein
MCFLLPFAFRGPPESFASSSSSPAGMSKVPSHAKSLEKHGMWTIFGVQSGQSGQNNHESALIPFTVQLKIGQSMSCNGNIYYIYNIYILLFSASFWLVLVRLLQSIVRLTAVFLQSLDWWSHSSFFTHESANGARAHRLW